MKFKIVSFFVFILFMIPQILSAQLVDASDVPPEIMQITTEGKLIVGLTSVDQPPFYYINEKGELDGYDIVLAKKLAANLGVVPEFNREAVNYNDVVALVVSGKIDIALTRLSKTLSRAKYVGFSDSYLVLHHGVILNRALFAKETSDVNISQFIRNYTGKIGVIERSIYATVASQYFPMAQIVGFGSWDSAVDALVHGDIPVIYRDSLELTRTQKMIPGGAVFYKKIIFNDIPESLSIAVKFDNVQLLNWINTFLKTQDTEIDSDFLLETYGYGSLR